MSSCGNYYGAHCSFTCSAGYGLIGAQNVTCLASNAKPPGRWDRATPQCEGGKMCPVTHYKQDKNNWRVTYRVVLCTCKDSLQRHCALLTLKASQDRNISLIYKSIFSLNKSGKYDFDPSVSNCQKKLLSFVDKIKYFYYFGFFYKQKFVTLTTQVC